MLKKRIITALVLTPTVLVGIYLLPPMGLGLLGLLVCGLSAWEWSVLTPFSSFIGRLFYLMTIILSCIFIFVPVFFTPLPFSSVFPILLIANIVLLLASIFWLWALLAVVCYQLKSFSLGFSYKPVRIVLGFLFLLAAYVGLVAIRVDNYGGQIWVIYVLLLVFAVDTGAYFVGTYCGKHYMLPKVSPKKTWEGFFGGLLLGAIVTIVASFIFEFNSMQRISFYTISFITMLFAVIGDLTISLLKRQVGMKDSGRLLPGHGGILDRLDSVIASLAVFSLLAILLGL